MPDLTLQFSQHSLNDFADCPRRFYLRYLARQTWPDTGLHAAALAERMEQGNLLHRWIERYWSGIRTAAPQGEPLARWWSHFLNTNFDDLPPERLPELALVAPLGDQRLYARFDLLAVGGSPRRFVIVDWKTIRAEALAALSDDFLRQQLQTRVYLYVLVTGGAPFNDGEPISPAQCSLRYWLADRPEQPWIDVPYSQAAYEQDRHTLTQLIDDVMRRRTMAEFEKTPDERHCTYCTYRTLCHRSGVAGSPLPDEEATLLDLSAATGALTGGVAELDY